MPGKKQARPAKRAAKVKRAAAKRRPATRGIRGVTQGVGRTTAKALGATGGSLRQSASATHTAHLPLPRAIGPYTVTRLTRIVETASPVVLFGAFRGFDQGPDAETWSNVCAVACQGAASQQIRASGASYRWTLPASGLNGSTLVPSAFTVSVMNPGALQTTSGIAYGGRAKTQLALHDSASTWQDFANDFVSYNAPRLFSAGKLALRGVTCDAVPYNMAALADFRPYEQFSDAIFSWNDTSSLQCQGFAPLVMYNPNEIPLQFIVTVEFRTRFPIQHVAMATHRFHPVASDAAWNSLQQTMATEGHGMRDTAASAGIAS